MKADNIKDLVATYLKDQSNKDKLIGFLEGTRERWMNERRVKYDRQWQNALSFYQGDHYVRDVAQTASQYKVRLRENHTNNHIQRMVSIFAQNLPITRVFPESISSEDLEDAESCEAYLKYQWRTKRLEQTFCKFVKYATIFGSGFMFTGWDPHKGGKLMLSSDETDTGEKEIRDFSGDHEIKVDDPFRIVVRPGIDNIDDMFDFYRSVPANRTEIEGLYGKTESDSARIMNPYTRSVQIEQDTIIVHHYYHKPTPGYEEGCYVCWTGKTILKVGPYPDDSGALNLIHLPFDETPLRFYGVAPIDQIIDLQEQLNKAASMIVEARNLVARPRVAVSHEAKMPTQSLSDRPGEVLRYAQAGGAPTFFVPSFNFGELAAHKSDVRNAIGQVTGMSMASRGEIPAAARTALALQLVLEQDRSQFAPFIKQFYSCINQAMYLVLQQAAQNISEEDPRMVKIEGQYSLSKPFHGGMVPSPLDIYLEDTNPLGWLAASRIETVLEMAKLGVLKGPEQVLDMIGLNSPDPALEMRKIQKQAAQKENTLLAQGIMLEIMPEDDDVAHLDEHTKPVASFSFRKKPKPVQDAHIQHIESHKQRLQAGSPPGGAPPQGGGKVTAGGLRPEDMSNQLMAQMPGGNMNTLLSKPG